MDPDRPQEQQEEQLPHGIGTLEITLTAVILLLLAGYGVYHFLQRGGVIGQAARPTPEEVTVALQTFFERFPMTEFAGNGAKLCIIVPMDGAVESFAVRKEDSMVRVRQAGAAGCDGMVGEDFIIRYVSRAGFDAHIADPGCAPFLSGGRGNPYWYLPSKLWISGKDRPECNADFQEKYCSAVAACIDPAGVPFGMFSCCADDKLTAAQREHVAAARGAA